MRPEVTTSDLSDVVSNKLSVNTEMVLGLPGQQYVQVGDRVQGLLLISSACLMKPFEYCVDQLYSSIRRHSITAYELKIRSLCGRTLDKSLK